MDLSDVFVRDLDFPGSDQPLRINQCCHGDVGCVVWDAALSLSHFITTAAFTRHLEALSKRAGWSAQKETSGPLVNGRGRLVLELGSGTGVVGLQLARLGFDVTLTDLPSFVPLLDKNIYDNRAVLFGQTSARPLVWGESQPLDDRSPDLIVVCDCLYYQESIAALVSTLEEKVAQSSLVLFAYEDRSDAGKKEVQEEFFKGVAKFMDIVSVPQNDLHCDYRAEEIHILFMTRKPDTTNVI